MRVRERQPQSELVGRLNAQVGPFFYSEKTVTRHSYLVVMLELYALLQSPPQTILKQDGAAPH
jgi:hypothetical protein